MKSGVTASRVRPVVFFVSNGASSVGNLAVSVSVARSSSIETFGEFSLYWLAYQLVIGVTRSAVAESALSRGDVSGGRRLIGVALGIGGVVGLLLIAIGAATGSSFGIAIGLALPFLTAFDHIRTTELLIGRLWIGLSMELAWSVSVLLTFGAKLVAGTGNNHSVFFVWLSAPAAIVCVVLLSLHFRGRNTLFGIPRPGDIRVSFGADYLLGSGSSQLATASLGAFVGAGILSGIRGAGTVLSPISVLLGALRPILIVRSGQMLRNGTQQYWVALIDSFKLMVPSAVLVVAACFIPDSAGTEILGDTWAVAKSVILPIGLEMVFSIGAAGAFAAHRARGTRRAVRRTLSIRASMGAVRIVAIPLAGVIFGILGAAWALAAIAALGLVAWWCSYGTLDQAESPERRM